MRTVTEVEQLLAERYSGPIKELSGFSYISWPDVVRQLDSIFGPTNWSSEPISFVANPAFGTYTVGIKLSATVLDESDGRVVTFSRSGFSTQVAQASNAEREQGLTISQSPKIHETAADGAASLAIVKASKQLGNAFGLYLYNKDEQRSTPATGGASSYTPRPDNRDRNGSARSGMSEKQIYALKARAGLTDAQIDTMTYGQAKDALDAAFGKTPVAAGRSSSLLD